MGNKLLIIEGLSLLLRKVQRSLVIADLSYRPLQTYGPTKTLSFLQICIALLCWVFVD